MDNSGPAFPLQMYWRPDGEYMGGGYEGLTKRELFAAMAMAGDWASQNEGIGVFPADATDDCLRARSAVYVRAADNLLAELTKEPQV